jgi:hypothetical protein
MLGRAKGEPSKDVGNAGIGEYGCDRGRNVATPYSRHEREMIVGTEHF